MKPQVSKTRVLLVLSKGVIGDNLANDSIANSDGLIQHLRMIPRDIYDVIIIAGGVFQENQKTPVSVLMYTYIKEQFPGIVECELRTETKSRDTIENFKNSQEMLREMGIKNVEWSILGHWLHVARIRFFLKRKGTHSQAIPLHYSLISVGGLKGVVDEALAWIVYLFDKTGNSFAARWSRKKRTFGNNLDDVI